MLDKLAGVAAVGHVGAFEHLAGSHAGLFEGREAARIDRLGHQRAGRSHVQSQLAHPFAGALGTCFVQDLIDHEVAGVGIPHGEDVSRDLD